MASLITHPCPDLKPWKWLKCWAYIQYIPRNMHTVFALLCFVVVVHWLIFPYPSGLLHWHCGNLTIAPVPEKQPWWIWINTSCEFIMNDCITTTKQSTTKPCAYFLGYTVHVHPWHSSTSQYANSPTPSAAVLYQRLTWMPLATFGLSVTIWLLLMDDHLGIVGRDQRRLRPGATV